MKHSAFFVLPLAAVFVLAASAQAQGPGGPGGPGGFQPPPAMMAKIKAWQRWRDSHKNVSSLQQTLGGLEALEQDPRLALSRPQARTVLAVLKKWQVKPALTDAQALQVNKQITAPLTLVQLKKIVTMPHGRGPGGFGGGGGRGPGGGGRGFGGGGGRGPGGGRPAFDPSRMPDPRDYNPLNPDTLPFARARTFAKQRHDQLLAALAASAK